MAAAGVGTLRFELSWALANPSPGVYDWTASDALVAGAAGAGIRPLPFLFETPAWVVAVDGRECVTSCAAAAPRGAAALEAWRAFAEAAARRYGPGGDFWTEHPALNPRPIRAWQIWNEQNSPTFFNPRPSPRRYAAMLTPAHDAITAIDPGARIILGGMFGMPRGGRGSAIAAWRFLARIYRRGAAADFDGVAAHPYAPTLSGVLDQVERIRAAMARAGDGATRLWITELGWASHGPASALNRGPSGQAQRLRHSFRRLLAERHRLLIANVDWYSWRDRPAATGDLCFWCPGSGLVDVHLDSKPSLAAFATLTAGR
jgi:polysaccharide biosynthesis protein PslG